MVSITPMPYGSWIESAGDSLAVQIVSVLKIRLVRYLDMAVDSLYTEHQPALFLRNGSVILMEVALSGSADRSAENDHRDDPHQNNRKSCTG